MTQPRAEARATSKRQHLRNSPTIEGFTIAHTEEGEEDRLMRLTLLFVFCLWGCSAGQTQSVQSLHRSCSESNVNGSQSYSIEDKHHDTVGTLVLKIATSPGNTDGEPVIRLACRLSATFSKERSIMAWIFDDKTAARSIALSLEDQKHHGEYLWHLRGYYERNSNRGGEYIEYVVPKYENNLLTVVRQRILLSP